MSSLMTFFFPFLLKGFCCYCFKWQQRGGERDGGAGGGGGVVTVKRSWAAQEHRRVPISALIDFIIPEVSRGTVSEVVLSISTHCAASTFLSLFECLARTEEEREAVTTSFKLLPPSAELQHLVLCAFDG